MEFLKTCHTNAHAVAGFEAIAYHAFSVASTPPSAPARPEERPTSDSLGAVEAALRERQQLVVRDPNAARPWLWHFCPATTAIEGDAPPQLASLEGYTFTSQQHGVLKALELARPAFARTANQGPAVGAQRPYPDLASLHELFAASVIALMSYHLVKHYSAVALNYRTLLSKPVPSDPGEGEPTPHGDVPYTLTSLTVSLTTSGILLVSTFSVIEPSIRCLTAFSTAEAQEACLGKCIRIAPNASLALVVGFDYLPYVSSGKTTPKPPKKKLKMEQSIEKWKSAVARWLAYKGYSLPDLDKRASWVRLRLAQPPVPDHHTPNQPHDILWPQALCFVHESPAHKAAELRSLFQSTGDPLMWFSNPQSDGYRDVFDVIEQWFVGRADREKTLEERRRAQKAGNDVTQPKKENTAGHFPSSPVNTRTGAYIDLQAASGMYPTPPDGVAPGTIVSYSDTPGTSGCAANTVLAQGTSRSTIDLSAPLDSSPTNADQNTKSPNYSLGNHTSGDHDDLFEDMDDDAFGGNGVTDADFNFFDDHGDVNMEDAPEMRENALVVTSNVKVQEKPSTAMEVDAKQDSPDPMAALDKALASQPGQASEHMPMDTITAGGNENSAMAVNLIKHSPPSLMDSESKASRKCEHGVKVSASAQDEDPQETFKKPSLSHRGSVFDPVVFDQKMNIADAKYQSGRFSFSHKTAHMAKSEKRSSMNHPTTHSHDQPVPAPHYGFGAPSLCTASYGGEGDSSDSASEGSAFSGAESEDEDGQGESVNGTMSVAGPPSPLVIGPSTIGKRKMGPDTLGTPVSVASFAESYTGDASEVGIQTDESSLRVLEANPWDWSLLGLPPPMDVESATGRFIMAAFPSQNTPSLPSTPNSQPDLDMDQSEAKPLTRSDCIAVVQVIADQIASATLDIFHEDLIPALSHFPPRKGTVSSVVKRVFPKALDCNLPALAAVANVYPELPQLKGQQRAAPSRPKDGPTGPSSHLFPLQAPYIRARRADTLWEVLPPAVAFWEALGLAPCSAPKNVGALCIYPHSESLVPHLETFLVNLKIAYEGCKLGNHDRVESAPGFEGGLVPWKVGTPNPTRGALRSLRETCTALGKALSAKCTRSEADDDNRNTHAFVIYMISPFEDASSVWELSAAFWTLFQAYGQGPNGTAHKPDLVLQIVPIKYVASFTVPVILDASTYTSLAREVYDRCPPSAPSEERSPLSIYAAPCIQLEEPPPRKIEFKISADPPQDLLRENSYIHVGYAISLDGNWLSAAWTDASGKSRTIVSYHVGHRPFAEIAREIWQITVELCSSRKVAWRICIAKSGPMEKEELEAWHYISAYHNQVQFLLILLTVDTQTPLELTPTVTSFQSGTAAPSSVSPMATPQTGTPPEPPTPAATPAPENADDVTSDPDARLVDVTDESWGVILAHNLHNTHSTVEFWPCLISAILVKRGQPHQDIKPLPPTPDPECGPLAVAVNILFIGTSANGARAVANPLTPTCEGASPGVSPGPSPGGVNTPSSSPAGQGPERDRVTLMWTPTVATRTTAETLLKEVLTHYRGLGTLARLKGIRGTRMGAVPWHIAVAKRGVESLEKCVPASWG